MRNVYCPGCRNLIVARPDGVWACLTSGMTFKTRNNGGVSILEGGALSGVPTCETRLVASNDWPEVPHLERCLDLEATPSPWSAAQAAIKEAFEPEGWGGGISI